MSSMGEFLITDGTTPGVDLLSSTNGFFITSWIPGDPDIKAVWNDDPLSDGRTLSQYHYGNITDILDMTVSSFEQDNLIYRSQELKRLCLKARDYQVGSWQTTPVYIRARGPNETNTRYALLINFRAPGMANPYAPPFFSVTDLLAIDDFILECEHGLWQENPPGTGTAIQVSALQVGIDGGTKGRSATTTYNEVFIGGRSNMASITHAYYYDASVPAFSANLIGAAKPVFFLPNPPAAGDYIAFGCNTGLGNSGPFFEVLFDIDTVSANLTTADYEISTGVGPTWAAPTSVTDNTTRFSVAGVHAIHFNPGSAWVPAALNGVTAYWFRVEITAVGGAPARPSQQIRDFYAVPWNQFEIDEAQVGGDIPALARYILTANGAGSYNRLVIGLRAKSRGDNFRSFINASDEQNPAGVTVSLVGGPAFATDPLAPSGRSVAWNPGAPGTGAVFWQFTTLAPEYYGTYHVFGRFYQATAAPNSVYAYLQIRTQGGISQQSDRTYLRDSQLYDIRDFGQVTLPGMTPSLTLQSEFYIYINLVSSIATPQISVYDLCLIPVDENAIDVYTQIIPTISYSLSNYANIDSISNPKIRVLAEVDHITPASKYADFKYVASAPLILQANRDQKVHILTMYNDSVDWFSYPNYGVSIQAYRNQRYFNMRGAR